MEVEVLHYADSSVPSLTFNQNASRPSLSNSFTLYSKGTPSFQQLKHFERDPSIALLTMAVNSGQSQFAKVNLLHSHTSAEVEEQTVQCLKEEIESNLKPSDLGVIVDQFQAAFDKNCELQGCASCGVRAYQMGNVNYEELNIDTLDVLKLSDNQIMSYKQIHQPYQNAISVYQESNQF